MQPGNEEADFRQALAKKPDDDTARQIFADWLEDRGMPEARIARSDWRVLPAPPAPNYNPELQIYSRRYGRRFPGAFLGTVNHAWVLYFPPGTLMYEGQSVKKDVRGTHIVHRFWYKAKGWNRDARGQPIRCHHLDTEIDPEGFASLFPATNQPGGQS